MKHKILALILAMLMLTGCAGNKTEEIPTEAPTQAAVQQETQSAPAPAPTAPAVTETVPPATTAPTTPPATQPAPPPTTAPTTPPAIVITKHPTSETVSEGAGTWFIAKADNETQITWEFFSPDGTLYSLQQTMSAHPGLILEVLPEDTLGLRQIPASFDGWSARARYDGPGGTATTERAKITVRQDPYADVLATYREVRRTGKGSIEKGLGELINPSDYLGYTLKDLDGNGVQELILASDGYNMYPYVIYEIYTVHNGEAVSVIQSAPRSRFFMLNDGRFLMEGSSGAMYSSWILCRFSGASISIQDQIWTSDQPHDLADFEPYYYYSSGPYEEGEALVYDDAARAIENWKSSVTGLSLTPIS